MNLITGIREFFKATLIIKIFSFVSQIFLGMYLTKEDFGLYGLVLSFTVFSNCLGPGIIQKILVQKGNSFQSYERYNPVAFSFSLISFFVLTVVSLVTCSIVDDKKVFFILTFLLALSGIMQSLVPIQKSVLLSSSRFREVADTDILTSGLMHGLTIPFCILGLGPYSFIAHKPIVHLLEYLRYNRILQRLKKPKIKFPGLAQIKGISVLKIFEEFKWLIVGALFVTLMVKGDYLVLGFLVNMELLGLYFFSYQLSISVANLFTGSVLNNVLLPEFSNQNSEEGKIDYLSKALMILIILFCPLFFSLGYLTSPVVKLIWGDKWLESIIAIKFLFFVMPLRFIPSLLRVYYESKGKWLSSAMFTGLSATMVLAAAVVGGLINTIEGITLSIVVCFSILGLGSTALSIYAIKSREIIFKIIGLIVNSYAVLFILIAFFNESILAVIIGLFGFSLINACIARKELLYLFDKISKKSFSAS